MSERMTSQEHKRHLILSFGGAGLIAAGAKLCTYPKPIDKIGFGIVGFGSVVGLVEGWRAISYGEEEAISRIVDLGADDAPFLALQQILDNGIKNKHNSL